MQIGAGSIGRGLLGAVYHEAGFHTTFADVRPEVVEALNAEQAYPVFEVSAAGVEETHVTDVDAINPLDRESFVSAVVEADVVTTAVGSAVLEKIAPQLADGLVERMKRRPREELHVVVVACENITDNTAILKRHIWNHLTPDQQQALEGVISFPNCVVDRIVPNDSGLAADNPLGVTVEDYYQLVVDGNALHEPLPRIPGMKVASNLDSVLEQKLFTLNTTHALVGYFGYRAGYEYIHEAIVDTRIQSLVQGALQEIAPVIVGRHPDISLESQQAFADRITGRFRNPHLKDTTARVARDPIRKLGPQDRLIRPAILSFEGGEVPAHLASGIVGALSYRNPEDPQSAELQRRFASHGVEAVLIDVSGVAEDSPVVRMAKASYELNALDDRA